MVCAMSVLLRAYQTLAVSAHESGLSLTLLSLYFLSQQSAIERIKSCKKWNDGNVACMVTGLVPAPHRRTDIIPL